MGREMTATQRHHRVVEKEQAQESRCVPLLLTTLGHWCQHHEWEMSCPQHGLPWAP